MNRLRINCLSWVSPRARGGGPSPLAKLFLFAMVLYLGWLAFSMRLPVVQNNHDVGHADSAAYSLQARGLVLNGSLKVPYISTFFHRGPSEIWRFDDHWPPMLAFLLAPVFRWGGVDAANAHAVCVGIGTFLLPVLAAWLALCCCRRVWAALLAAVLMLLSPVIFSESLRLLSDVLLAALLAGFLAALVAARRQPAWFLVAGLLLAASFYTKGSQVLLLVMMPLLAAVLCGGAVFRSRWFYAGLGLGALLIMPWWVTMWRNYGTPQHSTQNYVSSYFGVSKDWEKGFYSVYWDRNLPRTRDRFSDPEAWRKGSKRNLEVFLRSGLIGPDSKFEEWPALGRFGKAVQVWSRPGYVERRKEPPQLPYPWLTGFHLAGLVWGVAALLIWPVWRLVSVIRRWRRPKPWRPDTGGIQQVLSGSCAVATFAVIQAGFVIVFWSVEMRFTLMLMPLLAVLGCLACQASLEGAGWLMRSVLSPIWRLRFDRVRIGCRRWGWAGALVLCVATGVLAHRYQVQISDWQYEKAKVKVSETDRYSRYHTVAQGLQKAGIGGDAVIMNRNPWELLFYMPVTTRGVGLPYARPDVIFATARYYGVTHFILDCKRPGLEAFLKTGHPGLTPVTVDGPFPVYAFDATLFKEGELADLDALP